MVLNFYLVLVSVFVLVRPNSLFLLRPTQPIRSCIFLRLASGTQLVKMSSSIQTKTPTALLALPSKDALVKEFVGKRLSSLRTPALIVDRKKFKENCERVTGETEKRGLKFRAHVKSESCHASQIGSRRSLIGEETGSERAGSVKRHIQADPSCSS